MPCWSLGPCMLCWSLGPCMLCWSLGPCMACWSLGPCMPCWSLGPCMLCWSLGPCMLCWSLGPCMPCWTLGPCMPCWKIEKNDQRNSAQFRFWEYFENFWILNFEEIWASPHMTRGAEGDVVLQFSDREYENNEVQIKKRNWQHWSRSWWHDWHCWSPDHNSVIRSCHPHVLVTDYTKSTFMPPLSPPVPGKLSWKYSKPYRTFE